jgi:hypothetical protein
MAQGEDRIVLAIECGHCSQITGVQIYNGALRIVRCGMCGQIFHAADALVRQYQAYADHLARSEVLGRALQEAQEAMQFALEHWGRKAGKEQLSRALSTRHGVDP